VHAFFGTGGPYWTDLDDDQNIGWAFETGSGDDASRTITAGAVTIDVNGVDTLFSAEDVDDTNDVLPANIVVTLTAGDGQITVGGNTWGDDGNGIVDPNETAELNADSVGLTVSDLDFGMAIMTPVNPFDFARYFSLKGSAEQVALVGVEDVTVNAQSIEVEVNQSSPTVFGVPVFPVVDFSDTTTAPGFTNEQLTLFDTGVTPDGILTLGDLATLNSINSAGIAALAGIALDDPRLADHAFMLSILNTDDTGESRGIIDYVEAAVLLGGDAAAVDLARAADADGDGKIDPLGFEINTGGDPVYLDADSPLIRAEGFLELDILGNVIITGSVAFELGPVETVTLNNGTDTEEASTKTVTTLSIGASNVTAFVGVGGPYWTDLDRDQEVGWSFTTGDDVASRTITGGTGSVVIDGVTYGLGVGEVALLPENTVVRLTATDGQITVGGFTYGDNGNGDVEVDETGELSATAVGFHITDFDIGAFRRLPRRQGHRKPIWRRRHR
jgi:hypothetical protein